MISQSTLKSKMRDNFCRFFLITVLVLATLLHVPVYANDLREDRITQQPKKWHQTVTGEKLLVGGLLLTTVGVTVGTAYYLFSQPSEDEGRAHGQCLSEPGDCWFYYTKGQGYKPIPQYLQQCDYVTRSLSGVLSRLVDWIQTMHNTTVGEVAQRTGCYTYPDPIWDTKCWPNYLTAQSKIFLCKVHLPW